MWDEIGWVWERSMNQDNSASKNVELTLSGTQYVNSIVTSQWRSRFYKSLSQTNADFQHSSSRPPWGYFSLHCFQEITHIAQHDYKCWKFLELSWNFPLKSCRIGHVEGIFFSVLMLSPPPFTRNHVLRPWKRPILLTPGGASSRDDCGSPAMHKGPESQEQRLMVNPRDEVTSYCWWAHSCTMLTFVVWWNIPWIYSICILKCTFMYYIYDSHMFNLLWFYMVLPFFVHQQYVELDSLSNVSHLHDSRHPFCGDRFGHHEMRWSKLSAPTWRHQIVHLGQFFKNRVTPKHPFLQNGKNNALGYIYF